MAEHLEYPQVPFHALLQQAAQRWPDGTALVSGDRRLTFGEWDRQANRLAHGLAALGVAKGDRVAIFTPNCPEYEVAFFAITRQGAVPVPINPSYKEREVRYQLEDSGAAVLIVHDSLFPVAAIAGEGLTTLQRMIVAGEHVPPRTLSIAEIMAGQPDSSPSVELHGDDLAALPYSSGTTGVSKGVMLTQVNLVCNAIQYTHCTQTTAGDALLVFLPLYHIYGVALMASAVVGGAKQVLLPRFDLTEVLCLIPEERITELYVVPPVMLALANSPEVQPEQLRSLRFIMSAAAPLSPDVAQRVADRLEVPVIQAYGLTETSPLTHMVPLQAARERMGSVGVAAPDTRCRIVDLDTGARNLPPGEVGEIVIQGPQVMAGYWNAPDETARTLQGGWIHTGDIGREDEQGHLYLVDRKKEMIKYKAFSIAPAELEAVLLEHPLVLDCAVVGQPDPEAGEIPRAYVVPRPGLAVEPDDLQAFVRDRVAHYKQIRAVELVDAIPRTPSGKILRRVLREKARSLS